jgi:hypothetical protein
MTPQNRNTQLFGFNIAPLNQSDIRYTLAHNVHGRADYGEWTGAPSTISLRVEPYAGDTQFLVEWRIDPDTIPADQFLSVMQGIRTAVETLKLERGNTLAGVKVVVTDGTHTSHDTSAHALRTATARAFQNALRNAALIPLSQQAV